MSADILTCRDCRAPPCSRDDGGGDVGGSRTVWRQKRRGSLPTAATSATRATAPLDQINADELQASCRSRGGSRPTILGPRPEFKLESTPLMVERRPVLDAPAPRRARRGARSGHRRSCCGCTANDEGARGAAAPRQSFGPRARATGPTASEERILYVTPGYRLVALDAKTGVPVGGFGKGGVVDLKLERRSGRWI